MALDRYKSASIVNQIDGYMISMNYGESPEQFFERAKSELLKNIKQHVNDAEEFSFDDWKSNIKRSK